MLYLDMKQTEYFVAAATAGSYAAAARKLFVSPQALSKGVQALERALGVELFVRGPNDITLTPFGRRFRDEAVQALDAIERLQAVAADARVDTHPPCTVGIHALCFRENGGTIDWRHLLDFHNHHRQANWKFMEMRGNSIQRSVNEGSVDFGIAVLSDRIDADLDAVLLRKFPLAAIVAESSPTFEGRRSVNLNDLAQGELVLFSEEDAFNGFYLESARRAHVTLETSALQVRAKSDACAVIGGRRYSIRPFQHAMRTLADTPLAILPIVGDRGAALEMPLHLFWRRGRTLTALEQTFVRMIVSLYGKPGSTPRARKLRAPELPVHKSGSHDLPARSRGAREAIARERDARAFRACDSA
ncbi:LysR family transcriptional regulator [Eggerthellaceae bacterium zg-1084]|uniref:LysR family transcriptional regulator n=1 Tax=Berryella wangjianweii TaxID=2734634 RepID=UPI0015533C6C|nr:LysR family transcriptional regulator [Berryella wangjianweii]NPD31199.1 LysR family transcriptional regulator [Berryella wangjianweii]NPD32492.1 LysR family transcriptional regulator [Eggerthellaceae bacterium zg-997]